ncbi:MAG: histone-like nucleoid-structuring protein Lsr2 [Actinomycetes bacterium]
MAQEVITKLVDDLDGSEATETVLFGLDGENYEIDLSAKNAAALRKALDRYRGAARTSSVGRGSSGAGRRGRGRSRGRGDADSRVVRAWAVENGIPVSTRGRIAADVLEQYKAASGR